MIQLPSNATVQHLVTEELVVVRVWVKWQIKI